MIHISQSCKGGGFNSYPVLIELDNTKINESHLESLKSEVYKDISIVSKLNLKLKHMLIKIT